VRLIYPNFATNPVVQKWADDHVPRMLKDTRRERQTLNTRFQHFWRMHAVELKDDDMAYLGRSRVYLPATRRAIEAWNTVLMEALFPQSEWFSVQSTDVTPNPEQVPRWHALQKRYLQEMQLEDEFPLFLRQYLTFGTGILRHCYDFSEEPQRVWERQFAKAPLDTDAEERRIREEADPDAAMELASSDGTVFRLVEKVIQTSGPICRAVDLMHFYVAPFTARSLHEATLAFEDIEVPFTHVERQHERWMDPTVPAWGRIFDHPDWERILACKGIITDDMLREKQQQMERLGIDPDTNRAHRSLAEKGHSQLTEAFWRGEIPGAEDEDGKPFGVRDWHFAVLNDCFVVRAHPNLHYTNLRPWLDGRMYRTTRSYYAQGVCDAIASMQLVGNDTLNLTLDNLQMALSPPTVVDQGEMMFPEQLEWAPGALWFGKPDAVKQLVIPTQAQLGMSMLQMVQSMVQDGAAANFAVQGQPPARGKGRAAQSAQGMAQYAAAGSQEMLAFGRSLERQVLVKLLSRNYEFTAQFQTEKQTIQRLGQDGLSLVVEQVGVEDILGGYFYTWRGATGMRERSMVAGMLQQLPMLVQQLAMFDPTIAQKFDAEKFLRRTLADMGLPWADELFRTPLLGTSVDPRLELDAMAVHRVVQPHPGDQDEAHLMAHQQALMADDRFLRDPIARRLLMEHLTATIAQMQMKMQMAMQQQAEAAMQAMQPQEQQGQPPGAGSLPAPQAAEPPMPMGVM
jgi:hypothetical protein